MSRLTTLLVILHLLLITTAATTISQPPTAQPPQPQTPPTPPSEISALLAFKSLADPTNHLLPNWTLTSPSSSPCSWPGVTCHTTTGHVSALVIQFHSLSSPLSLLLQPLSSLTRLRLLSLSHNSLTGPLPTSLSNLTSLRLLFLSHNSLTGSLPSSLSSLSFLFRLDLSHNSLAGTIPPLNLPRLITLNLSSNNLSGPIPPSLSSFPLSSFSLNPSLCGPPIPSSCPAPKPEGEPISNPTTTHDSSPRGMTRTAVVGIVVGDFAVLTVVCGSLFCYFWKGKWRETRLREGEKVVYSSSPYTCRGERGGGAGFGERGRMVFFEGTKGFEIEELLRASAEMLGKGGYGTAYKAVLDDGRVVAVKRLREAVTSCGGGGRREFEQLMDVLGRVRHTNIVGMKAYYYARDEKLLVYEYMPGGSLFALLHANRGPGRTPLDWTTRMRIAAGAARGLAFIHHGYRTSPRFAHGNIKSTNILLDCSGNACIADFGLALLGPTTIPPRSNGYRPPENAYDAPRAKPFHKADVYAFGVLLLELLTGKYPSQEGTGAAAVDLPRWVQSVVREEWTAEVFDLELMRYKDIEEEMVGMLQIAMACTAAVAEHRPSMAHVLKMIEEIRGGEVSPSHESFDSVSDSPSVSDAGV